MSLKSIRESYAKLLAVFNGAGVKFNESQKADLDSFVLAVESGMEKQRQAAVRQTRALVEAKMEKEFKQVFEESMRLMCENSELASKVQDKITKITEQKRVSEHVDDFLDLYVESVLPKKAIVDYERMHKLEKIHESLKDALLVTDDAVEAKIQKLDAQYKAKKSACETEVAKMRVKLEESMAVAGKLKRKVDKMKAAELLESKTKDLPTFEARKVRKALSEATEQEIQKKFDSTLKEVKKQAKAAEQDMEADVKTEVEKILEQDDVDENDILRDRSHNGHVPVSEETDRDLTDEAEKFETMEEVQYDENGNIELDESDVINGDLMKMWCMQSEEIS